jgi:RNA polymerase sigma-70 factor (ECF subfamily)
MEITVNNHPDARPGDVDERALLARARTGDAEAFARLHDRHAAVVMSLCRRGLGGSLAEAEDATQETFIRAHRKLVELDDDARIRPWLYAIARHVCSERRRAGARRSRHEGQAMLMADLTKSPAVSSAEQAERTDLLERLSSALDDLDPRERLAVHLYYLERDPIAAARSALGLSRSGYYKLLARARDHLAGAFPEVQVS